MSEIKKNLGFGLMRLPMQDGAVDIDACCEMTDRFMAAGGTYFDTALMYCGKQSEAAVGKFLTSRHPRDSFTVATKLHSGFFNTLEDRDTVFAAQLEKVGVEHFDYYLIHAIDRNCYVKYTDLDCFNWLAQKKAEGKVKHMGFSFHDKADVLDKVLTEHPEVEFVQLQINYLDWEDRNIQSRLCYETARKHGKEVIVMEPVKGGTLAKLPEKAEKMFKDYNPEASCPSYAIRFAAEKEGVMMVLSGMSSMEQLLDNTSYMADFKPLSEKEEELVAQAVKYIREQMITEKLLKTESMFTSLRQLHLLNTMKRLEILLQSMAIRLWTAYLQTLQRY